MSMTRMFFVGLAVSACGALSASAAETPLNVKTGLWQLTMTTQTSGTPAIPPQVLASMTPDQREQFMRSMQARSQAGNGAHVYKECLTQDQLRHGFHTSDHPMPKSCKETIVSSTPAAMDVRMECVEDGHRSTSTAHFEAVNSENVKGRISVVTGDGDHPMTINIDMQSHWLGSDCGTVKPGQIQHEQPSARP